jgi:5-hydroxyisourate hydrolase
MSAARSPITTHVLDVALGKPARAIPIRLERLEGDRFVELARGETDADGRCGQLLPPGSLIAGTHRIRFELDDYFARDGRASFYPYVEIVFRVVNVEEHFHVPLLLSPFGHSTYRGS